MSLQVAQHATLATICTFYKDKFNVEYFYQVSIIIASNCIISGKMYSLPVNINKTSPFRTVQDPSAVPQGPVCPLSLTQLTA